MSHFLEMKKMHINQCILFEAIINYHVIILLSTKHSMAILVNAPEIQIRSKWSLKKSGPVLPKLAKFSPTLLKSPSFFKCILSMLIVLCTCICYCCFCCALCVSKVAVFVIKILWCDSITQITAHFSLSHDPLLPMRREK